MDPARDETIEGTNSMGQLHTNHITNEFPPGLVLALEIVQQHDQTSIDNTTEFRDPCALDLHDSSDSEEYFHRHLLQDLSRQVSDISDGYESPTFTDPESDGDTAQGNIMDWFTTPPWARQYKRFFRYRARHSTDSINSMPPKRQRGPNTRLHSPRSA